MIVTKNKTFDEILSLLGDATSLVLVGCTECATICETGGEIQLDEWQKKLELAGKKIAAKIVLHGACDAEQDEIDLNKIRDSIDISDAVLSFTCGDGTQTFLKFIGDRPLYPVNDTLFVGEVHGHGKYEEACRACGNCELGWTGGICPITKCAKGLLNGPCGGSKNRKCEVNNWMDCAWISIYERLEKIGQLDNLIEFRPPKDHSKDCHPRRVV